MLINVIHICLCGGKFVLNLIYATTHFLPPIIHSLNIDRWQLGSCMFILEIRISDSKNKSSGV